MNDGLDTQTRFRVARQNPRELARFQAEQEGPTPLDLLLDKYERAAKNTPDGVVAVKHVRDDLRALAAVDHWTGQ